MIVAAATVTQVSLVVTGMARPLSLPAPLIPSATTPPDAQAFKVDGASAERLDRDFTRLGYSLDGVANGEEVPRVVLTRLPGGLDDLDEPDQRKDLFLRMVLPLVLTVDETIATDRRHLQDLAARHDRGDALTPDQAAWVEALAEQYQVDPGPGMIAELLRRVDLVPPSLALAQAAIESGWGTSSLARQHHNLFGHTVENQDGYSAGMAHFATLADAVTAYIRNLNTHRAYEGFRRARAQARAHGAIPDGRALAATLLAYSELGQSYVDDVRSVIRRNGLDRLDQARLGGPIRPVRPTGA